MVWTLLNIASPCPPFQKGCSPNLNTKCSWKIDGNSFASVIFIKQTFDQILENINIISAQNELADVAIHKSRLLYVFIRCIKSCQTPTVVRMVTAGEEKQVSQLADPGALTSTCKWMDYVVLYCDPDIGTNSNVLVHNCVQMANKWIYFIALQPDKSISVWYTGQSPSKLCQLYRYRETNEGASALTAQNKNIYVNRI